MAPLRSTYDWPPHFQIMTPTEIEYFTVIGSAVFQTAIDQIITWVLYGEAELGNYNNTDIFCVKIGIFVFFSIIAGCLFM